MTTNFPNHMTTASRFMIPDTDIIIPEGTTLRTFDGAAGEIIAEVNGARYFLPGHIFAQYGPYLELIAAEMAHSDALDANNSFEAQGLGHSPEGNDAYIHLQSTLRRKVEAEIDYLAIRA